MNHILFDSSSRANLLPFTHTRPVADIRCGIMTMRERWELLLGQKTSTLTEDYLQGVFPKNDTADAVYINGSIFGNKQLTEAILALKANEALSKDGTIIAVRLSGYSEDVAAFNQFIGTIAANSYSGEIYAVNNMWNIFSLNERAIKDDYVMMTAGKQSTPIPQGTTVVGEGQLFIEEGAKIHAGCIINAATGPVYIGKGAEILEGTMIRGPLAMCSGSVIKMGGKIYGATTLGPGCKVGGEINNVVFFANSNKAHDGYLGNSVIGEWCNLGADTNCSNLKNNYSTVSIWQESTNSSVSTGLIFCGLMMADHSKCGINTMFNTGTVVGVSCNIYGADFLHKHIPSFSWGSAAKMISYSFDKAMETAARMMERRGIKLSDAEMEMYKHIFNSRKAK